MLRNVLAASGLILTLVAPGVVLADYRQHALAPAFVETMVKQHGFDRTEVEALLAQAKRQQGILDAIARPAEKTKEWFEYREIFVEPTRIEQGVAFWREHAEVLARAQKVYGVEPEIVVAIIGVETRYGRQAGKHRVLDALATLGFDYPPRADFFRSELEHFFLLVREQQQDALALTGSYAGAMGYGQFISSSYRRFAVDFDGDKVVDIWRNPVDAIGSVAHYFRVHEWREGQPVLVRAKAGKTMDDSVVDSKTKPQFSLSELVAKGFTPASGKFDAQLKAIPLRYVDTSGPEYWLGFDNFYCITRYNRSPLYARAVWELSGKIKAAYLASVSPS